MSVTNPTRNVTKQDLADFYQEILPYLYSLTPRDGSCNPVGTIITVMGNSAPNNHLICDGALYNIADYPELADYFTAQFGSANKFGGNGTTTFAVPDLRGEFLRMTGANSHANQGSGANVGVHQDGTTIPAQLLFTDPSNNRILYTYSDKAATKPDIIGVSNVDTSIKATNVLQSNVQLSAKSDLSNSVIRSAIRPTNTSVLYCIVAKSSNPLDYSTTEKVIGTWIDGKPVYQRVVHFSPQQTSYQAYTAAFSTYFPDSVYTDIVAVSGFYNQTYYNNKLFDIEVQFDTNIIIKNASEKAMWTVDIIVCYTKTTD